MGCEDVRRRMGPTKDPNIDRRTERMLNQASEYIVDHDRRIETLENAGGGGSPDFTPVAPTSHYTAAVNEMVSPDTSVGSAAINVTLPDAAANSGKRVIVSGNYDGAGFMIKVLPAGTDSIHYSGGVLSELEVGSQGAFMFISNGSNGWNVLH